MKDIPLRSIIPPSKEELNSFRIFSIREFLAGENMNQALHRHDFYFILLVSKGIGVHEIDFVTYPITSNSISIMRPGQVHKLELNADCDGYWLAFNKTFEFLPDGNDNALWRNATVTNFLTLDESEVVVLSSIFQTILNEHNLKQARFENVIKSSLEILLVYLARYQQKHIQGTSPAIDFHQQKKLQQFLDLLETDISMRKSAAAYADSVNLSLFQLNSITKTLLGKTVAELIAEQILLEAKRYLLGTANQIADIALQLGFNDVSYFIRFFRKKMGVTPEVFRKNSI